MDAMVLALVILCALFAAGLWDVLVGTDILDARTVSSIVSEWSHRWPILPFGLGLLVMHLLK